MRISTTCGATRLGPSPYCSQHSLGSSDPSHAVDRRARRARFSAPAFTPVPQYAPADITPILEAPVKNGPMCSRSAMHPIHKGSIGSPAAMEDSYQIILCWRISRYYPT
ncbi:hypothetical protein BU26DRAFT_294211 [Trematosphaeria pertusa]|uniref:Uncharacterized protein n=1 Tax=Trematosphaeria pertusa TaxID=390896 RepID=A0A6A6IHX1_9PLEO|nr:uncharacterized protein BU26DRAFT_294211 [Trematosphaeria pertusa]KAF2250011.1 hypothetical protein BU26DRAFT_294211 [Trematosphaeria pertusa]